MSLIRVCILADLPLCRFECFDSVSDPRNGNATWLETLIPAFETCKNIDIHWITLSKNTRIESCVKAFGQTFHILPRRKKLFSILTAYKFESYRIKRKVIQLKADLLHTWGVEDVYGLAGSRLAISPKLFSMQGCLSACLATDSSLPFLFKLQASFEKATVAKYPNATGESPIALQHLTRLNPSIKAYQIEYGVSPAFHEAVWKPTFKPTVLFVGSIIQNKGIVDLIEAFSRDELKHIKLKVAGTGGLATELKAKSFSNIQWLGKLTRADLIEEMCESWALVAPTYADTGPSVVKEARVIGMPIITTSSAGSSVYVEHGKSGYILAPGNISELVNAIKNISRDRESCITKGKYKHAEICRELRSEYTAEKFSLLYHKIVSEETSY